MSEETDLENIYEDIARTVYYGSSETPVLAIVDYGPDDELAGADDFGVTAALRVQAQGDSGLSGLEYGDQFSINGEIWRVTRIRKGIDGLEWIADIHRISRDV
jgi:hypothetical protein